MSDHHPLRDGAPVYDEHGKSQHRTSRFYVGRATCSCGALSDKGISKVAAWEWFRGHRRAASDAWDEADYRRDGDQALDALAASIREYGERKEEGE